MRLGEIEAIISHIEAEQKALEMINFSLLLVVVSMSSFNFIPCSFTYCQARSSDENSRVCVEVLGDVWRVLGECTMRAERANEHVFNYRFSSSLFSPVCANIQSIVRVVREKIFHTQDLSSRVLLTHISQSSEIFTFLVTLSIDSLKVSHRHHTDCFSESERDRIHSLHEIDTSEKR